jgi:hypothetical protein
MEFLSNLDYVCVPSFKFRISCPIFTKPGINVMPLATTLTCCCCFLNFLHDNKTEVRIYEVRVTLAPLNFNTRGHCANGHVFIYALEGELLCLVTMCCYVTILACCSVDKTSTNAHQWCNTFSENMQLVKDSSCVECETASWRVFYPAYLTYTESVLKDLIPRKNKRDGL